MACRFTTHATPCNVNVGEIHRGDLISVLSASPPIHPSIQPAIDGTRRLKSNTRSHTDTGRERERDDGSEEDQRAPGGGRRDPQGCGEGGAEGGRRGGGRGGERRRGGAARAGARRRRVRPHPHGQADAGHGRPRGDEADPGHGGDHDHRRRVQRQPPVGRPGLHRRRRRRLHTQGDDPSIQSTGSIVSYS